MKKRIVNAKTTIKEFFINFKTVLRRPDMIVLPGNLAFFFILAIIPSFSLISYGASILNLKIDILSNFLTHSFGPDIANLILGVDLRVNIGFHFFVVLVLGFYMASNGADSIITASNTIYNIPNKSWLKRRFKAFGVTFLFILLLVFMLIVPVFGNTIITLIKEVNINAKVTARIVQVFEIIKGPISWLFMFAIIRIIYAVAPDKKGYTIKKRAINYGALFTTIGFIIGTRIYSWYVSNYASYTVLYGSLANIVVLMIWIYYLSYVFTVGIALNSQKDNDNLLKTGTINNKNK